MKKYFIFGGVLILAISGIVISQNYRQIRERLSGYQEVPAVSTAGNGVFTARISKDGSSVDYELNYADTESPVTQSHIHFGQQGVNGGISVFLCSNLGNGPAGTQPCPPAPGHIQGTFDASDVIGPTAQGITAGQYDELISAMRAGATYVNIHTTGFPGGEVRSQIDINGHAGH
jgi:hypothetical protein